ncbi:unnamed protein product, partial [Rotaria magnacalcarata]
NLLNIFNRFLRQLFSSQCQLNSLQLDIGNYEIGYDTDECTELFSHSSQNPVFNEFPSFCTTLSRLHIHIKYTYLLEHLIEYTPALERLSIKFNESLDIEPRSGSFIEKLSQSNGDWCNKVRHIFALFVLLIKKRCAASNLKPLRFGLIHVCPT